MFGAILVAGVLVLAVYWEEGRRAAYVAVVIAALVLGMAAQAQAAPRWAQDGGLLARRHAQHGAAWFLNRVSSAYVAPPDRAIVHVAAAPKCHRRDRSTVLCWFSVHYSSGAVAERGFIRVHLQRNRLLGYKIP